MLICRRCMRKVRFFFAGSADLCLYIHILASISNLNNYNNKGFMDLKAQAWTSS